MQSRIVIAGLVLSLAACGDKDKSEEGPSPAPPAPPAPTSTVVAAKVAPGALKQLPWLLGTFRGTGVEGTTQAPFYERYSLADDSTLVVESFKDSTLAGAIDTTRYEVRRDSLSNPGTSRYVATAISADSVTFGPLVGVNNGFTWRRGDNSAWIAVIIPATPAKQRTYRMARTR
jgi:hypothetical protein